MRKYGDIIIGLGSGLALTLAVGFDLEKIQLINSIIILILLSIGFFRIIKQARAKAKTKRKDAVIDNIVDHQKPIIAVSLALNPTKEGEKLGKKIIRLTGGAINIMKKIKTFFEKFKGYLLTTALAVLTVIEMCGGHINAAFGGALTVNGVEVLPVITLACTVIVGCISNGFTKEQAEKIKAIFSKSSANELVIAEIKKTIKEDEARLKEFKRVLVVKENELDVAETTLNNAKNTLAAKKEMYNMIPQLATAEDVELAARAVVDAEAVVNDTKTEIEKVQASINKLNTTINALRSQL